MAEPDVDWDKTKENIRPLRQGLPSRALSFSDVLDSKTEEEFKKKRAEFEERIKNPNNSDPLSDIISYVKWIEQCYPKGGTESGLEKVLRDYCLKYYNEAKASPEQWHPAFDDERYVKLWLKLTRFANPSTIFECMLKSKIGKRVPDFYISWATELESLKNFTDAEKILEMGMENCSENPESLSKLQSYQKQLLDRDCRFNLESVLAGDIIPVDPEEERSMLGALKPVGKEKNLPPISRIGDAKLPTSSGILPPRQTLGKKLQLPIEEESSAIPIDETDDVSKTFDTLPEIEDALFPQSDSQRDNLVSSAKVSRKPNRTLLSQSSSIDFSIYPDFSEESSSKGKKERLDKPSKRKDSKDESESGGKSGKLRAKDVEEEGPTKKMWDSKRFATGSTGMSFEEGMAEIYRSKFNLEYSEGSDLVRMMESFFSNLSDAVEGSPSSLQRALLTEVVKLRHRMRDGTFKGCQRMEGHLDRLLAGISTNK